jgi:hypothetical protein
MARHEGDDEGDDKGGDREHPGNAKFHGIPPDSGSGPAAKALKTDPFLSQFDAITSVVRNQ